MMPKPWRKVYPAFNHEMYHTRGDEEKSAIVERFNKTLNGKMRIHFEVEKCITTG